MGASETAIEGVSAARKVHGILCAAAVFGAALLVAACTSTGDTFAITPFLREQITGDTWRACLAREYQVQTRLVLREGRDWADASRLSDKGWAALRGASVTPWAVAEFELEGERLGRLTAARSELDSVLSKRDASACGCGKVQAAFDGWLAASARIGGNVEATQTNFASALEMCRNAQPRRVEAR